MRSRVDPSKMPPFQVHQAFEITLYLSVLAGLGAALRHVLRREEGLSARAPASRLWELFAHPFTQFLLVVALLFLNQLLFNVYVRVEHRGDAWFMKRWLGEGWCDVAPYATPVTWLVGHLPFPASWLGVTVLRVQAFLELPFVLFAYLSIARLLDRALHRALARSMMLPFAAIAFTITFSLVEILLENPWTRSDLWVRAVACVVTPFWIVLLTRHERARPALPDEDGRPRTIVGLLAFLAGAGAIGALVLVSYDVALLYNLAHLHRYGEVLAVTLVASTALVASRRRLDALAARLGGDAPSARTTSAALAIFTFLFFVPSLTIRYFALAPATIVLGCALVLAGVCGGAIVGLRDAARRGGALEAARWLAGAVAACAAGAWCAWTDAAGLVARGVSIPEAILLRKSLLFLLGAVVAWGAVERLTGWEAAPARGEAHCGAQVETPAPTMSDDACATVVTELSDGRNRTTRLEVGVSPTKR
jgi:hypothetical protein